MKSKRKKASEVRRQQNNVTKGVQERVRRASQICKKREKLKEKKKKY